MGAQQVVSAVPQIIDALVALAVTALGDTASVYDGVPVGNDPGNFLVIGLDNPDSDTMALSATSEQDWASARIGPRQETGTITCAAVAWNNNADAKAARDAAFAIVGKVAKTVAADVTLGVGPWVQDCRIGSRIELNHISDAGGVLVLVEFQVAFAARIYPPA